jgi:hypothetical protein
MASWTSGRLIIRTSLFLRCHQIDAFLIITRRKGRWGVGRTHRFEQKSKNRDAALHAFSYAQAN